MSSIGVVTNLLEVGDDDQLVIISIAIVLSLCDPAWPARIVQARRRVEVELPNLVFEPTWQEESAESENVDA